MRLPWQKHPEEHADPHSPHAYRLKTDGGIGAVAAMGGSVGRQVGSIASASASTRTYGCAVPGCGKPPDALIHAPEE